MAPHLVNNERLDRTMTNVTDLNGDVNPQSDRLNRPALGLVVDSTGPDRLAGTILRAQEQGLHVLVGYTEEKSGEAVNFAHELGATMVPLSEEGQGQLPPEDVENKLAHRARKLGFPGLVIHDPDAGRINYSQSLDVVNDSQDYVVEARIAESQENDILLGIPAYNEEVSIGSVILSARAVSEDIVVVDDGSEDSTAEVARQAGATVIEHEVNRGKGAAIQTLFEYAETDDFEALVVLDGDGQHLPEDIPQVAQPVIDGEADLVIGSRYIDQRDDETPLYRRFGQQVLDYLTIGSSKTHVTDSQSGFRALSPNAIDTLALRSKNFGIESEMIDAAAQEDLTVVEQPIDVRYEGVDGQTQNPLRHGLEVVAFILQLVRDRHPLLFFGFPGIIIAGIGVAYGIDGYTVYQQTGQFYPVKVWVSGFLTLVGTLGLFIGLVLNSIANTIARNQN